MSLQRLVVSSFSTGLETDVEPFLLNNDAFPVLENAYVWRKRILKKRGTEKIGRLRRALASITLSAQANGAAYGVADLLADPSINLRATEPNASIVPGTLAITVGAVTFTDNANGTLTGVPAGNTGTINYQTAVLTLAFVPPLGVATNVVVTFSYFPTLPVMGIESYEEEVLSTAPINNPDTIYFDTIHAYRFDYATRLFFDVGFYKMAAPQNRVVWSGFNYQQFLSASLQNVMFVTNNNPGFHFTTITAMANQGPLVTITMTLGVANLAIGDQLWFNSLQGVTVITNGLVGTVSNIAAAPIYDVTFTVAQTINGYVAGTGVVQLLTNSIPGQDGIRWYDGFGAGFGFVNFAPPLDSSTTPSYLVGARILIQFNGRLNAIGTFERQGNGNVLYFANRVRYSQLGTVFYNSLLPINQTGQIDSWYASTGKGGFYDIDTPEKILTATFNQEALILGMESSQKKVIATSNSLLPYIVQNISTEFGSESTHAAIVLDKGVLSVGDYGYILTTTYNSQRFDLKVVDEIYQIKNSDNGNDRVSGIRDYRNEFVYFTYTDFASEDVFPNRTLLYNFREDNFAIFREQYTTYGYFREQTNQTWATLPYLSWEDWTSTWASGKLASRYPNVAGGNQQGYVMKKDIGTANSESHYILNIVAAAISTINSPDHSMEAGDFILIRGCIGNTSLNGSVVKILTVIDNNNFTVDGSSSGVYLGGGEYSVLDNFLIKTKMFPIGWDGGRGVRVGSQRYLLDTTSDGEMIVNIYTSQNDSTVSNDPSYATYLINTQVVRTRPDDSLGLHDSVHLQSQIWHRLFGSFMGDTIQFGFTLSEAQMRDLSIVRSDVVLHAIVSDFYQGSKVLA